MLHNDIANNKVQAKQKMDQWFLRYKNLKKKDKGMFSNTHNHIFEVYNWLGCILPWQMQGCIWNDEHINAFLDSCDFLKEKAVLSNLCDNISQFYESIGWILIMQMQGHIGNNKLKHWKQCFLRYLRFCERGSQCFLICMIHFLLFFKHIGCAFWSCKCRGIFITMHK